MWSYWFEEGITCFIGLLEQEVPEEIVTVVREDRRVRFAKTVARVSPLACTNEYLLRTMDSLVAVQ